MALAAAIALFFFFGPAHGPVSGGPSIEAAYYLDQHAANQVEIPLLDHSGPASAQLERTAGVAAGTDDQTTTDAPAAAAGVVDEAR